MKHLSKLAKAASLLVGLAIAVLGFVWFWIGVSGALHPNSPLAYFAGASFLIISAPLLAFPFAPSLAKALAVAILLVFAIGFVGLAFRTGQPLEQPALVQAAAIALAVLLIARIGLAWFRRHSRLAT